MALDKPYYFQNNHQLWAVVMGCGEPEAHALLLLAPLTPSETVIGSGHIIQNHFACSECFILDANFLSDSQAYSGPKKSQTLSTQKSGFTLQ